MSVNNNYCRGFFSYPKDTFYKFIHVMFFNSKNIYLKLDSCKCLSRTKDKSISIVQEKV